MESKAVRLSATPELLQLVNSDLRAPSSVIQVPFLCIARVVKWQTRTFEGRMP
jgi:hypothetical protein